MRPTISTVSQQQALLDWLHWGGQLIISGGAGQSFSLLRESFLGPYLPAEATGETVPLTQDDLRPLVAVVSAAQRSGQSRRSKPAGAADEGGSDPAVRVSLSGAGADPAGAESPALSVGLEGETGRLHDSAGRGEPSSAGGRAAGGPRADHDAHDQPE